MGMTRKEAAAEFTRAQAFRAAIVAGYGESGLSQAARDLNVSQSTVSRLCSGQIAVTDDHWRHLTRCLRRRAVVLVDLVQKLENRLGGRRDA